MRKQDAVVLAVCLAVLLALSAAASYAASPASEDKAKRQCFWTNSVNGYNTIDDKTVRVNVSVRDVYELDLFAPCPDVDWSQTIALVSRGGSMICSGLDAEIITPSAIGPRKCAVRTVRKLTPAEIAAPKAKTAPAHEHDH